jgi:methylglutaconyl-CoA hydratase
MSRTTTIQTRFENKVMTVALNRPEIHNAINPLMVSELSKIFREIDERDDIRVVVLTGNGPSFCAGADLSTMRDAADKDFKENFLDGKSIYDLMLVVDQCSRPVVGKIHGAAFGGGVGLVSCCDIAVVADTTTFAFSESRLGIVPAVISPFIVSKIGTGPSRALFLTGERFDAEHALEIGLVNYVVPYGERLEAKINEQIRALLSAAPQAQTVAKKLIQEVASLPKDELGDYTGRIFAKRRMSSEGREGMNAFLEKRKPSWSNQ